MTKNQRKTITDRFSKIYEEVSNKYFDGKTDLANKIGTHTNVLNDFFTGKRSIGMTSEQIEKLLQLTPINEKWLLGDDNAPIYIESNSNLKPNPMEKMDELLIRIELLEKDRNSYRKKIDELLIENEVLKRKLGKKEVG